MARRERRNGAEAAGGPAQELLPEPAPEAVPSVEASKPEPVPSIPTPVPASSGRLREWRVTGGGRVSFGHGLGWTILRDGKILSEAHYTREALELVRKAGIGLLEVLPP